MWYIISEELRLKASQLRNALGNLKVMKTTEGENKRDLDELRSTVGQLSLENTEYKEEISQLKVYLNYPMWVIWIIDYFCMVKYKIEHNCGKI
jgi:hypothetical protein